MAPRTRVPVWHWVAVILFLAWNLLGVWLCWLQIGPGASGAPGATDYDRALYAALPSWYDWCYAAAVGTGALGAAALLARSRSSVPLLWLSLIAIVIVFGYLFRGHRSAGAQAG